MPLKVFTIFHQGNKPIQLSIQAKIICLVTSYNQKHTKKHDNVLKTQDIMHETNSLNHHEMHAT